MSRFRFPEADPESASYRALQGAIEALPEGARDKIVHALDRHDTTLAVIMSDLCDDFAMTPAEWAGAMVVVAQLACRFDTAQQARVRVVPMSPGGDA